MIGPETAAPESRSLPRRKAWANLAWLISLVACGPVKPVPVFLWHSVGEGTPNDKYDVSVEEFEQQLQILNAESIRTVTLDQVLDDWEGRTPIRGKAVV